VPCSYFISQGEWKDEKRSETGIYQLVAMSPSTIILTLWLHDAQGIGQEVRGFFLFHMLQQVLC